MYIVDIRAHRPGFPRGKTLELSRCGHLPGSLCTGQVKSMLGGSPTTPGPAVTVDTDHHPVLSALGRTFPSESDAVMPGPYPTCQLEKLRLVEVNNLIQGLELRNRGVWIQASAACFPMCSLCCSRA